MVRWLTGHAFLRLQDFRAGVEAISVCRLCAAEPERADHILLACPRLAVLRRDCFRSTAVDEQSPEWEVSQLLKFLQDPRVSSLEDREREETNRPVARAGSVGGDPASSDEFSDS